MANTELGPLAPLLGVWEGDKGQDTAPSDDRGVEHNPFRERMTFELLTPVQNHEQFLYGLRYQTVAYRLSDGVAFHEELGYWLWDPAEKQVMKCFLIPRAVAVVAGGTCEPGATQFEVAADLGSTTYGVLSNRFLDREFRTVRFTLKVTITGAQFSYEEDTQLQMKGVPALFHHTDRNTLKRVG